MCLAVPGKVLSIEGDDPTLLHGPVDFAGVRRDVCFAFTPEVKPGEYVLVHVGFALSVVDEAEAQRTYEDLKRLGELQAPPEDGS
jgi:hydrogenase expression/formation protein HypC